MASGRELMGTTVPLMGRLLLEDVSIGAGFGREALEGLRAVNVNSFFGGMALLIAGLEDVAVRNFSRDFRPSAELGLEDVPALRFYWGAPRHNIVNDNLSACLGNFYVFRGLRTDHCQCTDAP